MLAKQVFLDCHVASLLAMTALGKYFTNISIAPLRKKQFIDE